MLRFVSVVVLAAIQIGCADAYCNAMSHSGYGPRTSKAFPPGWNGLAQTPFTGWRSWYAFYTAYNQSDIVNVIDALTAKNRTVKGWDGKVSLCDLGFCSAGLDEGWEGCGEGVNKTQHYVNGTPAINTHSFPDMKGLVDYGHSKGVKMGWYFNGCGCIETHKPASGWDINYEGDIQALYDLGFDGVKFDGCGMQCNSTEYAFLMNKTGKAYEIENCHWGDCTEDDASSCPTVDWCPFNWYRTSGDSNNGLSTWYDNLQTTIRFQSWDAPVSQPGCWAYPDMLQVGRLGCSSRTSGCPVAPNLLPWTRAYFAAFAIMSSPLVLSINPTDENLEGILDIIGNKQAHAINQAWVGHPGTLVKEYPPITPSVEASEGALPAGVTCHDGKQGANSGTIFISNMTLLEGVGWCKNHAHCGGFSAELSAVPNPNPTPAGGCAVTPGASEVMELYFYDPYGAGRYTHPKNQVWAGWKVGGTRPVAGVQLWAKPISATQTAALFINGGASNYTAQISLKELNISSSSSTSSITTAAAAASAAGVTVQDVWTGADAGPVTDGVWSTGLVDVMDSRFVIFTTAKTA